MNPRIIQTAGVLAIVATACSRSPQSPEGFHLPEGDIERGKIAFVELNCATCHTIAGVALQASEPGIRPHDAVNVSSELLLPRSEPRMDTDRHGWFVLILSVCIRVHLWLFP